MNDRDKLRTLLEKLETFEHRIVPSWQRPILEIARQALESEISSLARQLRAREIWIAPVGRKAC